MKRALVPAIVTAVLAGTALAQQFSPQQAIAFLDRDGDGKCSLNEFLTYQAGRMSRFDASGDGVLQYAEFKESLQGRGKQAAQRSFDAFNIEDERRALTRREFLGYHAYVFREFIDTDSDGFMSAAEWEKIVAQG